MNDKKATNKPKNPLRNWSLRKTIIIIAVVIFLAIAIPVSCYFYNQFMNTPNFTNPENNFITVSKTTASPGEELTYEINIKNEGRRPVTDIHIKTDIPANTTFTNKATQLLEEAKDNKIYFLIEKLGVGEGRKIIYTLKIDSPLDNNTTISNNTFEIEYKRAGSDEMLNKKFPTRLMTTIKSSPDFSKSYYKLIDENEEYLRMGDVIKVVLNIKNIGNMNAKDITIKDIIPENTDYIDQSFTSNLAYLDKEGEEYLIRINELEINEYVYINYSVKVNSGLKDQTKLLFNPYIKSNSTQYILGKEELVVRAFPDLSKFTISAQDENGGDLLAGDIINYTVSITNSGDGDAYNIVVANRIPQYTSFVSTTLDATSISWSKNKDRFGVLIPVLESGESIKYNFRVMVNNNIYYGTKITNYCTLSSENSDEINSNSVTNTVISNYSYNVVCLGDSQIVKTSWTAVLHHLMEQNYPYGDFNFYNSGKNGETITLGYNRMIAEGILGVSPYIFIINYGTNDAFAPYGRLRTSLDRYANYLSSMIDTVRNSTGAMVVVMSTGPSNENLHPYHKNANLSAINSVAQQVCAQKGAIFVDVFNPMIQSGDPNQFLADGLHYNDKGSQFVGTIAFNTISKYLNKYGTK